MEYLITDKERFCFIDWGRREYGESVSAMKEFLDQRISGKEKDSIFLVEHDPVITMGRRGTRDHLVGEYDSASGRISGIPVHPSDRGGDVTLHAPGQLVIYPVIVLKVTEQRLHDLLSAYEELIIRVALDCGVDAFRVKGKTGAWTKNGKLASIGIHLRRWTTYHGISLNVRCDLSLFDKIIPCGLHGIKMTSLEIETGQKFDMEEVKSFVLKHFPQVWEDFRNKKIIV
jgi:lipoyl(octanoyl) transferase